MTERERLIQLIGEIRAYEHGGMTTVTDEGIADYLLANGIIVPMCEVGRKVFVFRHRRHSFYNSSKVWDSLCDTLSFTRRMLKRGDEVYIAEKPATMTDLRRIGSTVFLDHDEAEYMLEQLRGGESICHGS